MMDKNKIVKLEDLVENISVREANPSSCGLERYVGLEHLDSEDFFVNRWGSTSKFSSGKRFQKGDILFCRRRPYLRKCSVAEFEGICSGDAFVLRLKENTIAPGLLKYILNTEGFWKYCIKHSDGSMSPRVKWQILKNYEVELPSFNIQLKAVDMFDRIYDLQKCHSISLENTRLGIKKIGDYFWRSLDSNIDFDELRMGDVCIKIQDGTHFSPPTDVDGEYYYVTAKNIKNNQVRIDGCDKVTAEFHHDIYKRCDVTNGDVLLTKDGTIGEVAIFGHDCEISLLSSVAMLRPVPELVKADYLAEFLRSNFAKVEMARVTSGSAIRRLTLVNINSMKIKVPKNYSDQLEITNKFKKMRQLESQLLILYSNCKDLLISSINNEWAV